MIDETVDQASKMDACESDKPEKVVDGTSEASERNENPKKKSATNQPVKPSKGNRSRKRVQMTVDEFIKAYEDQALTDQIFNLSFNGILRNAPMSDNDDGKEFIEGVRAYLIERRDEAKAKISDDVLANFKRYVRFQAKLAVVDVVLNDETQEARRKLKL